MDNLLSFSQMGRTALKPRPLEVGPLIEEIRQKLMMEAKDRRITWRIRELPPIVADPFLIRLVLENLLSNAVKYTRPREVALIEIGATREGEEVIFFVRDNGVGFDMKYVNKLFGVFQRLHRIEEFEGTGIGLAICKKIVELYGGRIWVESGPGKGATIFFTLPAA